MAKIVLSDIEKVDTSKTALNQNFTLIEQEFQNKVLYRDNPVGEPNSMATDLDMDSNDILNVGNIDVQSLTANGKTLDEYLAEVSADGLATKAELEAVKTELEGDIAGKQDILVSGTSIRTVNGNSLLGSGNIVISSSSNWGSIGGTLADQTDLNTALNAKQPLDPQLTDVAGLTPSDGSFIVGNGTNFITESGSTARASLGLGTAATANTGDFATAAQGAKADTAIQPSDITDVLRDGDIGVTVQAFDANTAKTNVANNFTEPNEFDKTHTAWTPVAFNATQTLNALIPAGTTTLTGNMTLNAVSNSTTGEMQVIVRVYTQDATGGRTLAYNTSLFSAAGAVFPQPSSAPNSVSLFQFTKMPDGKWAVQSLNNVRST